MMRHLNGYIACIVLFLTSCTAPPDPGQMMVAQLDSGDGLPELVASFESRNPGYAMSYLSQVLSIAPDTTFRLAFLQKGGGSALIDGDSSKISVGDIIYLEQRHGMKLDSLMDFLVFTVPDPLPVDIPTFIRPDWDLNITDVPGGCATETNAYRRILLTWLGKNGKYLYHGLNAHRVRIMDSFTHYHPVEGGFDEFYLVQMALPDARLLTSEHVDLLTHPDRVNESDIPGLINETPLQVGDLIYLPRGVAHRGVGGVLAQVITVPGFVPGSEIGVDHHIKLINTKLGANLPYNQEASLEAVVK